MKRTNVTIGLMVFVSAACGLFARSSVAQQFDGPGVYAVDSLLKEYPLAQDQSTRIDEIAWDSLSSVHLIQVRDGVDLHFHADHDENVMLVRGAGRLVLAGEKYKVKAGDVIHIPRGTQHSFYNLSAVPAVVISVFSPGFNGNDRVYVTKAGQ